MSARGEGFRVAMVGACPYPVPQGSQVLLRDTARGLRDRGHDVHLVVYGYGGAEEPSDRPIHRCRTVPGARRTAAGPSPFKPFLDAALVATLRRVVREERIQVVHAHNYEGLIVALAAGHRPIIYHAHNAMADELPHFLPGNRFPARLGTWLDGTFPKCADHVIAPHDALAGYLAERGCDPARISTIPPPVDPELLQPCHAASGTPPVLYAGNLDRYQNLGLLALAMERVRGVLPDARFVVATAQPGRVPGAEMVSVPDAAALRDVMAQEAVFACPRVSWSGYPMKLLNAMAAGMAVVACAGAAYPLSHEHDGIVVPDNDADAFGAALAGLLENPERRRSLGEKARETALSRHDPDAIAARIEALYEGLTRDITE